MAISKIQVFHVFGGFQVEIEFHALTKIEATWFLVPIMIWNIS